MQKRQPASYGSVRVEQLDWLVPLAYLLHAHEEGCQQLQVHQLLAAQGAVPWVGVPGGRQGSNTANKCSLIYCLGHSSSRGRCPWEKRRNPAEKKVIR